MDQKRIDQAIYAAAASTAAGRPAEVVVRLADGHATIFSLAGPYALPVAEVRERAAALAAEARSVQVRAAIER